MGELSCANNFDKDAFILSSDTLCGTEIDLFVNDGWNNRNPLFLYEKKQKKGKEILLLKGMIRQGVPPILRCAVWTSSIIYTCNPQKSKGYSDNYRTVGNAQLVNSVWETVLQQMFPDESDFRHASSPNFGNTNHIQYQIGNISDTGNQALAHVLCGIEQFVGLEFCPLLPPLCALFLRYMPDAYAFYCLREMSHNSINYFPITQLEHYGWCHAFANILKRLHPQTAASMEQNGSLTPGGLDPIFRHFFLPILPYDSVLRILDIYTLEGHKVIFRFGVALLCMFMKDVVRTGISITTSHQWWQSLRHYSHSDSFRFVILCKKAYGYHGNRLRKRLRFPRRRILDRIIKFEQDRAESEIEFESIESPQKPLGLLDNNGIALAKQANNRAILAKWLTPSLKLTKLDLVFSTNIHGRTLDLFYQHVKGCAPSILLCQVLNNNAVIGVFASQEWVQSSQVYGDGECFLFRLDPDPQCWKWKVDASLSFNEEGSDSSSASFEMNNNKSIALMEQFMVGRENFISMGGNDDGGCGFRLNEDFTKGESCRAKGFENDPLPLLNSFDVGVVEVYQFARAIDGKTAQQVLAESFQQTI
mmetsp:Transcript_7017/g.10639  ORF Transcript_7017/g.10639 Transcript_7017/m.10639 type:complete len:589 (-) Transcript_7017:1544-3310(-)